MALIYIPPLARPRSIEDDARRLLGAFGPHAQIFRIHSAGDSGDGCEVIEFTTPSTGGRVPWTAHVTSQNGRAVVRCSVGW